MRTMILGCAFIAVAGVAGAQPPGGGFTPPTFDGLDTDKNGSLSQAEVATWVATLPAGPQGAQNPADVLGRWDTNKDGMVSRQEFDNRPRRGGAPGGGPPAR